MYIIAVDGGGTKCKASLFTPQGEVLATCITGPANLYSNFDGAIAAIEDAANKLLEAVKGLDVSSHNCLLSLGCAGASIGSVKARFANWQHNYHHALLTTDIHVSCLAARHKQSCALVIVGTGSCVAILDNKALKNKMRYLGGHGFLLGDIGSGAWLGKKAVSWYLQALETPCGETTLFQSLQTILGTNISEIIEHYGQATAVTFGHLVPAILQAQSASSLVDNWLDEGAHYFAKLLTFHVKGTLPIYIDGGLGQTYAPRLQAILNRPIHKPEADAVHGAYFAAVKYSQQAL